MTLAVVGPAQETDAWEDRNGLKTFSIVSSNKLQWENVLIYDHRNEVVFFKFAVFTMAILILFLKKTQFEK